MRRSATAVWRDYRAQLGRRRPTVMIEQLRLAVSLTGGVGAARTVVAGTGRDSICVKKRRTRGQLPTATASTLGVKRDHYAQHAHTEDRKF